MSAHATSRPVSLVLVSHSYPPVLGGSEIEAQRVCAALLKRGHRVMVLCAGGPPMPDSARWIDPAGVPVRIFARGMTGPLGDYAFALGVAWTLLKERRTYQLVYFLMQGVHLAVGLPVARWLGKAIVVKISGSGIPTLMRRSWMGRRELRWMRKWAYRVMILNEGLAGEALAAGLTPDGLLWMPNPVDTDEFAPCDSGRRQELRARLEIPAEAEAAVFVGRLAPEKELASLIGAFAAVVERRPQAALILVGEGPSRASLEARAAQLGLAAHVRFAGRQPAGAIRDWLQACDLFVLVSSNEGFPCSLAEAMSAGLASVVSDIPGNTQLVDAGVHGLRVPAGDEARIAEAVGRLLGDADARARMGLAARRRVVDNYSTERVADRYEKLFAEALSPADGCSGGPVYY
ncbi:MAG: glycosyltransferase family 4 protein [Bryobacteraceae bacterium]|jgi:glycosyltransferase involved in cell wall biosynthesis